MTLDDVCVDRVAITNQLVIAESTAGILGRELRTNDRHVAPAKFLDGRSHDVSSSVPALTRIRPSLAGPAIHDPQSGQTHRILVLPLSAMRWSDRGSTPLRRKPVSATTSPILNALLVNCWQSRQWQAYTNCGASVIS
jgi:hypothetical protein